MEKSVRYESLAWGRGGPKAAGGRGIDLVRIRMVG